jgi:tRNA(Ile)-lysidine synthase TilS/MesJ
MYKEIICFFFNHNWKEENTQKICQNCGKIKITPKIKLKLKYGQNILAE